MAPAAATAAKNRRARRLFRWRLSASVRWEIGLSIVALLVLTLHPVGYVSAGVLLVVLLTFGIPFNGQSLLDRINRRLHFRARARARVETPEQATELVPLAQWLPGLSVNQTRSARGDDVGVITDGVSWTALLSVVSDDELIADSGERIDLDALSGLTIQEDIVFAALQVITFTSPAPTSVMLGDNSPALTSYHEIITEAPPPAIRRTWLGVRLDPRLCLEAVASRGSTNDAIYATLRFGLHRVQSALKRQGINTRELSANEMFEVLTLTSGSNPGVNAQRSTEHWEHWACDGFVHRGRRITNWGSNTSLGYQAVLDTLDNAPILFGLTSFTLDRSNRASGAIRLVTTNTESAMELDEWLTRELGGRITMRPGSGDQVPVMLGTVPLGRDVESVEAPA